MYCPQCATHCEQALNFCTSCGLKLSDHARLLEIWQEVRPETEQQLKSEKRLMTGVVLLLATSANLLVFLTIFRFSALSQVATPSVFLWMLLSFLTVSLITGCLGVAGLVRSGFFKTLKERQLRYELAMIEQKRRMKEAGVMSEDVEMRTTPRLSEQVSITPPLRKSLTREYKISMLERVRTYLSHGNVSMDSYADKDQPVNAQTAFEAILGQHLRQAGSCEHVGDLLFESITRSAV